MEHVQYVNMLQLPEGTNQMTDESLGELHGNGWVNCQPVMFVNPYIFWLTPLLLK